MATIDNLSQLSGFAVDTTTRVREPFAYSRYDAAASTTGTPTTVATTNTGSGTPETSMLSAPSAIRIARERTAECILLQQKLDEATAEISAINATNVELRQREAETARYLERTSEALRVAGDDAANARADAEAAEATAATMATQLQAFSLVVEETKKASQVLYKEQEELTASAQMVESKLVRSQAELDRSQTQRQELERQIEEYYKKTLKKLEQENQKLESKLAKQQLETIKWKKQWEESNRIERKSQERIGALEEELKQAKDLLLDATSRAAEAEASVALLKEALRKYELTTNTLPSDVENASATNEEEEKQEVQEESEKEEVYDKENNNEEDIMNETPMKRATKCSICLKDAVGIMKKCQCGNKDCICRAHATCVNKIRAGPSVSHPCTPAQRLPVVLCVKSAEELFQKHHLKMREKKPLLPLPN